MDNIDQIKLREVIEKNFLFKVSRAYGDEGVERFRQVARTVKDLFEVIDAESYQSDLIVFKTIDDTCRPLDHYPPKRVIDLSSLQQTSQNLVLQVLSNGRFLAWNDIQLEITDLAKVAVVYHYQDRIETVLAGSETSQIEKVGQYASIYSVPTFSDLQLALDYYRSHFAKYSSCEILKRVWNDDCKLYFKGGKPEAGMRDSLVQFLKSVRNAETRPEQNMGVSYPVDIKMTFFLQRKLALIEVKWMGDSIKPNGNKISHRDKRARDGAKQLAEYLEKNRIQVPTHLTRGYLIVFDGRRRRAKQNLKQYNSKDAGYYRDKEIKFDPSYEETVDEFETPLRIFLEPTPPIAQSSQTVTSHPSRRRSPRRKHR